MNTDDTQSATKRSLSRRTTLRLMGLGAVGAVIPTALSSYKTSPAQGQASSSWRNQSSKLITKEIPRTREKVPAIGMGTFLTFDVLEKQPRDHIRQVMRRFWEGGGRMIDVSPLYGMSEVNVGALAKALGITNDLFITNKIWATGEYLGDRSQAEQQFEQSLRRLSRDRIDAMQVHTLVNVDIILPLLKEWKQAGKIRYVGVTHHEMPLYSPAMLNWIEKGDLDFVQIRYSILERGAEERILPASAERGTAVLANMPFEKARLFQLVQGRPLPDFTREFGCENWAQFFLKYVISHPAVTAAIPATTNLDHVVQNMGALKGTLPDNAMRARMVKHIESLPGFDTLAQTPPYPGKKFTGLVSLPGLAATQGVL
jgi:diketogulonate reductase-like aldo/keto reductase